MSASEDERAVAEVRVRVNGDLCGGTIAWSEHVEAWEAYSRRHRGQSAQTIARRGGFGLGELVTQLGHMPLTWEPDARTRFMPGVSFTPVAEQIAPLVAAARADERVRIVAGIEAIPVTAKSPGWRIGALSTRAFAARIAAGGGAG